MKTNKKGLDLIKTYEGLMLKAYRCPANVLTIGYGRTTDVQEGDTCTEEQAEQWLLDELRSCERYVNLLVSVPISDNQKWALMSFIYNLGSMAFQKSTLLKLLNKREYAAAAEEFHKWNKADGIVLPGLVFRRAAESELFKTADSV